MLKKFLPVLIAPLLLAGCATTSFTNLTPQQESPAANSLYRFEVALSSRQQTLRWNSIQPKVIIGADSFPMRPTPLMTNRWEGLVPVPVGTSEVRYRYRLDFQDNAFGKPTPDSATSPEYILRIREH